MVQTLIILIFSKSIRKIAGLENKTTVWRGDFNLVKLKKYKTINNENARKHLPEIINEELLIDPYRVKNVHLEKKTTTTTSKT